MLEPIAHVVAHLVVGPAIEKILPARVGVLRASRGMVRRWCSDAARASGLGVDAMRHVMRDAIQAVWDDVSCVVRTVSVADDNIIHFREACAAV